MDLLTPGYWPNTYWPRSYWNDLYWPNHPIEVVGESLDGGSPLRLSISEASSLRDKIERGSKVTTTINKASPL